MYMKIIVSFQINFMHSLWFPLSWMQSHYHNALRLYLNLFEGSFMYLNRIS